MLLRLTSRPYSKSGGTRPSAGEIPKAGVRSWSQRLGYPRQIVMTKVRVRERTAMVDHHHQGRAVALRSLVLGQRLLAAGMRALPRSLRQDGHDELEALDDAVAGPCEAAAVVGRELRRAIAHLSTPRYAEATVPAICASSSAGRTPAHNSTRTRTRSRLRPSCDGSSGIPRRPPRPDRGRPRPAFPGLHGFRWG